MRTPSRYRCRATARTGSWRPSGGDPRRISILASAPRPPPGTSCRPQTPTEQSRGFVRTSSAGCGSSTMGGSAGERLLTSGCALSSPSSSGTIMAEVALKFARAVGQVTPHSIDAGASYRTLALPSTTQARAFDPLNGGEDGAGMTRRPRLPTAGTACLPERDVYVRRRRFDLGDDGCAARAVVGARPADDGNRHVAHLLGHEALQAQRALR